MEKTINQNDNLKNNFENIKYEFIKIFFENEVYDILRTYDQLLKNNKEKNNTGNLIIKIFLDYFVENNEKIINKALKEQVEEIIQNDKTNNILNSREGRKEITQILKKIRKATRAYQILFIRASTLMSLAVLEKNDIWDLLIKDYNWDDWIIYLKNEDNAKDIINFSEKYWKMISKNIAVDLENSDKKSNNKNIEKEYSDILFKIKDRYNFSYF